MAAAAPLAAAPRRPFVVVGPIVLVIVAILGVLAYTLLHGDATSNGSVLMGQPAPAFGIKTFDGQQVDLTTLRGKPVMVNFWGSWCVPCKDEAPVLQQAWSDYRGQGVQFVGVAIWDKEDAARTFAASNGAVWLNGMDDGGRIAIDYGVYGVPESFFLNRDGVIVDRYVGPFTGNDGASRLGQYLKRAMAA